MPIELLGVYARYGGRDYVLRNVNARISGDTVILGPNGSGKTTLMRAILGFVVSREGKVLVDGVDVDSIRGAPGLMATNLREVMINSKQPVRDVVRFVLELVDGDYSYFTDVAERFLGRSALAKNFTALSEGQRRVVLNAMALASRARSSCSTSRSRGSTPRGGWLCSTRSWEPMGSRSYPRT